MTITKAARVIHLCAKGWALFSAYDDLCEDERIMAEPDKLEAAYKAYCDHVAGCQECPARPEVRNGV